MAIFNDLKRIFFGAKSVAKHQAEKAGDAARELGNDLKSQSDDLIQHTKEAAGEFMDKAPEYLEKGKGRNLKTFRTKFGGKQMLPSIRAKS